MKPIKQHGEAKGALELIEEAFFLLRQNPATLAGYYVGSLPFVLALLFFWSDMSRSAFAQQHLAAAALVLSLLFLWMKTWQALFGHDLLSRLSTEAAGHWSLSRFWKTCLLQTIVQPSGLFLLPVALGILVPFGWVYAFYQNLSVLGNGAGENVRQLMKRAWRQATLWP